MSRLSELLLPAWARSQHPLLRYELSNTRRTGLRWRLSRQLIALSLLLGGAAAIYALASPGADTGLNLTRLVWQALYFPALILQLGAMILALTFGAAAVGGERSRKTWDNLRVTEAGAGLALRARWAGILYRLRAPIATILLARFILAAGMLYDLTAFDGRYGQMLGAEATPPLPAWRADLLLIALAVTVNLLLPCLQVAVIAALGILLSVAIRERLYATVILTLVIVAQLALAAAGAFTIVPALGSGAPSTADLPYALVLGYSVFGDWGLLLAQLGSLGEIWHRASYGSTISLALMLWVFGLGLAADGMMWLAGRLSEGRG